jgi:hypothetical protein
MKLNSRKKKIINDEFTDGSGAISQVTKSYEKFLLQLRPPYVNSCLEQANFGGKYCKSRLNLLCNNHK